MSDHLADEGPQEPARLRAVPTGPAPTDWGLKAQRAAEERLGHLELAEFDDRPLPDGFEMSGPAFCGCTTCVVRETLVAAWPILLEAAREELDAG